MHRPAGAPGYSAGPCGPPGSPGPTRHRWRPRQASTDRHKISGEVAPMTEFHAELTLPNDPAGVGLARAFVRELARLAGFADAEGDALAGGAAAACANLCALAFDPGDAATYTLRGDVTPAALTLAIREQGIPFDPQQDPRG